MKSQTEKTNGDYVLCRLMVPKLNEKTPAAAELLFSALHGVFDYSSKQQAIMSFEIISINKFVQFYFYVPKRLKDFVEGQFYAQYPDLEITEVEDYTRGIKKEKYAIGLEMKTQKEDVYPIKTFQSFEADPLSGFTSILGKLNADDEVWIQFCISPSDDRWQKRSISYVKSIEAGHDPGEPVWKSFLKSAGNVLTGVAKAPLPQTDEKEDKPNISGPMTTALKAIEEKAMKLGYKTVIRVISLSPDYTRARHWLNATVGAFKQFNASNINGFIQGRVVEGESIVELYQRRYLSEKGQILNTEELASLFHLPGVSVETPSMDYAGSRKGEPPQNLPVRGKEKEDELSVIGKTNFRGEEKIFGIKVPDRALHMYAIGKTGTGKSTLLKFLAIDDINKGRGMAIVDPHGDLIQDVLEYIPEERLDDVVYFSPADSKHPVGFNLLENTDPEYKNIIASGIVGVFKKIFGESWGPRLEYILRNVILGLLDYKKATLLSVLRVLTDMKFRREVVSMIEDPVIKDFFINEFERYDQKFRTEAVAPIQNKVGQFLSSTTIRNIVGQEKSTIDVRKIMDEGKILLIDLSIGKIGEDNSTLLGSLMITKIQMAAMSRADVPPDQRRPFYLYVDEFQNFATDSFAVIVSEARKYGLYLFVTNQYIAQMPENVANAVFGNIGTLITFRVGAKDAEFLNREFVPVFEPEDLSNLNNYNIYLKMSIDGLTSAPFSAQTLLPMYEPHNLQDQAIEKSRVKYSKPREEVEEFISKITASSAELPEAVVKTSSEFESRKSKQAEQEINKADRQELPEELKNIKEAEDYNANRWYFTTRTAYKDLKERFKVKKAR